MSGKTALTQRTQNLCYFHQPGESCMIMYADDTTVIISGKTEIEDYFKTNFMMKKSLHWFVGNSFFIDKTGKICFSLNTHYSKE